MVTIWKRKPVVIDPVTAPRAKHEPLPDADPCPNCGDCTSGNFCRNCGQARRVVHVSLREMAADFMDDQLALNSKLPVTLAFLLVRPGHLTREYLKGRIASYIRPLRLYVGTSVLFFVLFAWLASREHWINMGAGQDPARDTAGVSAASRAAAARQADAARREMRRLQAQGVLPRDIPLPPSTPAAPAAADTPVAAAPAGSDASTDSAASPAPAQDTASAPGADGTAAGDADPARDATPGATAAPLVGVGAAAAVAADSGPRARPGDTVARPRGAAADAVPPAVPPVPGGGGDSAGPRREAVKVGVQVDDPDDMVFGGMGAFSDTLNARFRKFQAMEKREMQRTIVDALQEQLPRMMFAMLPIFALWLKLLYVRRGRFYVEHFIFSLHFHAFVFLLLTVTIALEQVPGIAGSGLGFAVAGWIFLYLFLAMKVVYGQGLLKTALKYFTLLWCYFFTLNFGFLITVLLWVYFL